jgi:hypothetical protein
VVEVEVSTLDSLLESLQDLPLLIKIDVEGAETRVFRGGLNLFSRADELALIVEFEPSCLHRAGVTPEKLMTQILSLGYKPFLIDRSGVILPLETAPIDFVNVLFVKGGKTLNIAERLCASYV